MTDPVNAETADHRKATRFGRRFAVAATTTAALVVLGALGGLYHVQEEYQNCTARFLAHDSLARSARADASYEADRAQQKAFAAAAKLIDPEVSKTITEQDILTARDAFKESSTVANKYTAAVKAYPYQNFKEECLS